MQSHGREVNPLQPKVYLKTSLHVGPRLLRDLGVLII